MKFYVGHIEYSATGEGLQHYIYAGSAKSKVDFIENCAKEHGYFLVQWLDVYEDTLPDNITKYLPEYVANTVKEYMVNGADCMFTYSSRYYVNYS